MKWVSGDGLGLHGAQSALIMRITGRHSVAIHVSLDGCAGQLGQRKAEGHEGRTDRAAQEGARLRDDLALH